MFATYTLIGHISCVNLVLLQEVLTRNQQRDMLEAKRKDKQEAKAEREAAKEAKKKDGPKPRGRPRKQPSKKKAKTRRNPKLPRRGRPRRTRRL